MNEEIPQLPLVSLYPLCVADVAICMSPVIEAIKYTSDNLLRFQLTGSRIDTTYNAPEGV